MSRVGSATLPLHGGKAPRWLFDRMALLAPEIVEAIVVLHGRAAFFERLSDPYWFQAFGCVLGFDWHSSGVTTTVCGALKQGLMPRAADLGIFVAGGKGKASRATPAELIDFGNRLGMDGNRLAYMSRMAAKVDSAAVQDGFGIYHHSFFLSADGGWAVVQQGMRENDSTARRYHWLGARVEDFVNEPHAAIASDGSAQQVLNLVAAESSDARSASADFARVEPRVVDREIARVITLSLPKRHWVDIERDISPAHLRKVLLSTYEASPQNFEQLLAVSGVGAKAVRALALVADVVYGKPASLRDPARFSFAHGGKDGHPYPVNRAVYDHSIEWLRDAVGKAKVGRTDKLHALRRLADWTAERGTGNAERTS
ncbi:MAG TPA: DUF763 domain-containing protein [Gemmatimonadaceae bacterium]|nr:DUF763 domain-containing protein [Gemmatimonadaceae bacterium]